jgi:hypothetical protein
MCPRPDDINYLLQNLPVRPRQSIDDWFSRRVKFGTMPEQSWMSSGGDETSISIFDVNYSVSRDPKRAQHRVIEPLASHGLDGVSPEFRDFQG